MTAIGLIEIYRLDPTLARDQSVWIVVGLVGFLGLILVLRDVRKLENYKYTLRRRRGAAAAGDDGGRHHRSTAPSCGSRSAASRCSRASSPSCCW